MARIAAHLGAQVRRRPWRSDEFSRLGMLTGGSPRGASQPKPRISREQSIESMGGTAIRNRDPIARLFAEPGAQARLTPGISETSWRRFGGAI